MTCETTWRRKAKELARAIAARDRDAVIDVIHDPALPVIDRRCIIVRSIAYSRSIGKRYGMAVDLVGDQQAEWLQAVVAHILNKHAAAEDACLELNRLCDEQNLANMLALLCVGKDLMTWREHDVD